MFCYSGRKASQRKRDDELRQLVAESRAITSSDLVQNRPDTYDRRTIIFIWGQRALIHKGARRLDQDVTRNALDSALVDERLGSFGGRTSTTTTTPPPGRNHLPSGGSVDQRASHPDTRGSGDVGAGPSAARLGGANEVEPRGSAAGNHSVGAAGSLAAIRRCCDTPAATEDNLTIPLTLTSLPFVQIMEAVCGDSHLLLLSSGGTVYSFGIGVWGQLGLGEQRLFAQQQPEALPQDLFNGMRITQIAAGKLHSVALSSEGSIFTWGIGDCVGDGRGMDCHTPRLLRWKNGPTSFSRIAAGYNQAMALTSTNDLYIWGETFFCHYHAQPYQAPGCSFPMNHSIVKICIGRQFALALSASGSVFSWGDGTYCELGVPKGSVPRTAIFGRAERKGEHQVPYLFRNRRVSPTEILLVDSNDVELPKIVDVAAGARHSLLLDEEGCIYSFGDNLCGQCGVPSHVARCEVPRAVKIQVGDIRLPARSVAAGCRHSAAITDNDNLATWGHSGNHKLIHTAPSVRLLEERFGVEVGRMGVSVKSGVSDCCTKPRLVHTLLHQKVSLVCLGDEFTVVITGEGEADSSSSLIAAPSSVEPGLTTCTVPSNKRNGSPSNIQYNSTSASTYV